MHGLPLPTGSTPVPLQPPVLEPGPVILPAGPGMPGKPQDGGWGEAHGGSKNGTMGPAKTGDFRNHGFLLKDSGSSKEGVKHFGQLQIVPK